MNNFSSVAMQLNDIKPYILANVKLQCKKNTTARMSIVGSPGCGKSDIIRQICKENGWGLSVKYLSNMSMEQITGIPCKVENGSSAKWTKPEIFNFSDLEYRPPNYEEGKTVSVLLIDDFHLADKIIQKYLFQILTYKSLNGYKLPENTAIIMAGNRITDKALAHTIPAPVMNRISVYEVYANAKDWIKNYAFSHNVRNDVISFINTKGDVFLCQEPIESSPWASPRSWTFLSEQMDSFEEVNGSLPIDKLNVIATGLIGAEYSSEFIAYREIYSKWDVDKLSLMKDEELVKLFTKEIEKNAINGYALINSISSWMISKTKELDFNTANKDVISIVNKTYNLMTIILGIKCKGIQIKPLIIAGLNYIYMFSESIANNSTFTERFNKIKLTYLKNMMRQRDIDWIYYEIAAYIFGLDIDKEDKKKIEIAKDNLKIN